MIRIFGLLCWMSLAIVVSLGGCSSKQEEVAMAPVQAAPSATAPVQAKASASTDGDSTTDDGSDTDGGSTDDESMAGDETTTDDGSTGDSSGDSTMTEDETTMTEDDGSGRPAVVRAKPKNLREQAEQAFGDGYESAAYRLMQAHILSSSSDASELLAFYRWSPAKRQPQLGARIAIGVELTAPSEIKKDFKPIGSLRGFFSGKSKGSSRAKSVQISDIDSGDSGDAPRLFATNERDRILQKYTGLMGDVLVNHLKASHAEGNWAPIFQSLTGVATTKTQVAVGDGTDDGTGGTDDGTGGTDDVSGAMSASPSTAELATKLSDVETKYISVGPTLSFIGRGSTADLLEQAKEGDFDALIVFDVEVSINLKIRMIYNECRAKLIGFSDGKSLAASKLLKNTEAQKEIDKTGMKYVETAMQPVLIKLDEIMLKELPANLTPEIIKTKRLDTLIKDETRAKLDLLTEIRLWREKSLLEEQDVAAAYEAILGEEDGKSLANGSDEERLAIVKKLLAGT